MNTVLSAGSPFALQDTESYKHWREQKLAGYPTRLEQLVVEVANPGSLTPAEHAAIMQRIRRANMAITASHVEDTRRKEVIRSLGRQFGLDRLDHNMCADDDAITSLTVQPDALHQGYIPYSTRPIAWHTDGYYNDLQHQIRALLLHCVQPAASGGANKLLDHEILYILLRDRDPGYIEALSHPEAMTIPANIVDGEELRPARTGPVFSLDPNGYLHMRYTDRSRSIEWRSDPATAEAVTVLKQLLNDQATPVLEGTLQPGQGLISNNVLHTRSGFTDGEPPRLLYRARYFDHIDLP